MNKQGYYKLKGFLVENNIKQKVVADMLGISVPTFNKKLNVKVFTKIRHTGK